MIPRLNHTQIPNIFIEKYMHEVSGNATKIFLTICRKTIGWHKETDIISQSQIKKITGIKSHHTIQNSIKELIQIGLIIVSRKGQGKNIETFFEINYNSIMAKNEVIETNMAKNAIKDDFNMAKIDIKDDFNMAKIATTKESNINKKYKESSNTPAKSDKQKQTIITKTKDRYLEIFIQKYKEKFGRNYIINDYEKNRFKFRQWISDNYKYLDKELNTENWKKHIDNYFVSELEFYKKAGYKLQFLANDYSLLYQPRFETQHEKEVYEAKKFNEEYERKFYEQQKRS